MVSTNTKTPSRQTTESKATELWVRADKEWEAGRVKSAFRLMLAAVRMGERGAQVTLGYMYDNAVGTKRNVRAALYWYKRAYRRGESCAAHNIGIVWRDAGNFRRSLYWFERAIRMNHGDDGEAFLEIAKLYLNGNRDRRKAASFLRKVCRSKSVTQDAVEQAQLLLKREF